MSEEKKTFFASLEPKSALVVGAVAGLLIIGTIGFIIMLFINFGYKNANSAVTGGANNNAQLNQQQSETIPVVTKSDKPQVELFIMSYCPYGLQMQKAFTPVWNLLQGKADFSIKFVSYAMHDLPEVEENTRQYCIETEQANKYLAYADCFTVSGDYQSCLSSVGVSVSKLNACVDSTNKKFGILDKYNDKSTWLSGLYPVYPIHQDLNNKYGVQGSPTLVINGNQVDSGRSPEAIKQVVCAAFNGAPSECSQVLNSTSASAGFGAGVGSGNASAECGS
ncbi:MAG: hypothetical protein WCX97_00710 [Candidatus Magasanikbacteria bacterium]